MKIKQVTISERILLKILPLLAAALIGSLSLPAVVCAEPKAYDMILPEADTRLYNLDELRLLPAQVLAYARNEIYARHGRKFRSQELTGWFESQVWYNGRISPSSFDEGSLNYYERENVNSIIYLEERIGAYKMDDPYGYDSQAVEVYLWTRDGVNILDGLDIYMEDADTSVIRTDRFILEMPADVDWEIEAYNSDTFSIFYVPSRASGYDGEVVTIMAVEPGDDSYFDDPSWKICGYGEGQTFVAFFPTDVRFSPSSRTEEREYTYLLNWVRQMDVENEGSPFEVVFG